MKPKQREERLWEYRVDYSRPGYVSVDCHYYMCEDAPAAIKAHAVVADHHDRVLPVVGVLRKCPYRNQWIDETDLVTDQIKLVNERKYERAD